MKIPKEQFDTLLQRLLKQEPEKTAVIKGKKAKNERPEPIIPKPVSSSGQQ
jgi:hypothetical protein